MFFGSNSNQIRQSAWLVAGCILFINNLHFMRTDIVVDTDSSRYQVFSEGVYLFIYQTKNPSTNYVPPNTSSTETYSKPQAHLIDVPLGELCKLPTSVCQLSRWGQARGQRLSLFTISSVTFFPLELRNRNDEAKKINTFKLLWGETKRSVTQGFSFPFRKSKAKANQTIP